MKSYDNAIQDILDDYSVFGYLAHNYGSDGQSARGMWDAEVAYLVWLALQAPQDASFIDVGCFCGSSTVLMSLVRRHQKRGPFTYSVDVSFKDPNSKLHQAFNRKVFRVGRFDDIVEKI